MSRKIDIVELLSNPLYGEPVLKGFELGFNERADVAVQAADGTDLNEMWQEIQATLAIRNAQRDAMINQLTFRVTKPVDLVGVPAGQVDFEVASEYGQPVGIRGGKNFNRGYTFEFYDLGVRFTWMFLAQADRLQLQNLHNMALEADNRLQFNTIMKCAFNPTNLVGVADSNIPVNVYKFYNGDGEIPPPWKTNTFLGTHTHYFISGNTTITPANLRTLENDLYSHGYGVNWGTQLVLWVNRQERQTIQTFRVTTGADYDFIPSSGFGGGVFLASFAPIVARPAGEVRGEIGTYGPWHIVEDDYIPPTYLMGLASGGPDALINPIGFREHENPAYQGLKIIPGARSDYPLYDSFYRHGLGVGVRQRGAGVLMQVKASGNYAVPTIYA